MRTAEIEGSKNGTEELLRHEDSWLHSGNGTGND